MTQTGFGNILSFNKKPPRQRELFGDGPLGGDFSFEAQDREQPLDYNPQPSKDRLSDPTKQNKGTLLIFRPPVSPDTIVHVAEAVIDGVKITTDAATDLIMGDILGKEAPKEEPKDPEQARKEAE